MISRFSGRSGPFLSPCTTVAALIAAGCAQLADPLTKGDARLKIAVEADTVVVRATNDELTGTIVATYTNPSDRPVYLGTCGRSTRPGFTMDKEVGGEWVLHYDPVCALGGGAPLEVRPGESRTDTLRVWDTLRPNSLRYFQTQEIPGTYRIAYEAYDCCRTPPGGGVRRGSRLPREAHVSESFRIEVQQ